jgi:hypothetical protein
VANYNDVWIVQGTAVELAVGMGVGVTGVPVEVAEGVMRVGVARGVDVRVGVTVGVSVGR